jgi:hypothetical protein
MGARNGRDRLRYQIDDHGQGMRGERHKMEVYAGINVAPRPWRDLKPDEWKPT